MEHFDKESYKSYLLNMFDSELDTEAEIVAKQSFTRLAPIHTIDMISLLIKEYGRRDRPDDFLKIYNAVECVELGGIKLP